MEWVTTRRAWLWGAIGLLILIAMSVLTIGVIAKVSADASARAATQAVKEYAAAIVVAAESSADPKAMVVAIEAVQIPDFEEVTLGEVSEEYRSAKQFFYDVTAKTDNFKQTIKGYAQTLEFYSSYETLKKELAVADATNTVPNGKTKDTAYLESYYELLKKMNNLIEKTAVASDYATEFVELGRVYDSRELNMEAIITSLKQQNETAFNTMYEIYAVASAQVPRVETALGTYAASIPQKVQAARDEFKKYEGSL